MRAWIVLILLAGILGCAATDETEDNLVNTTETSQSSELGCECTATPDRATPTFECTASGGTETVYLCEDGQAGLDCMEATSSTWSSDDLTCESVFCVTTDQNECQVDCACTDERS